MTFNQPERESGRTSLLGTGETGAVQRGWRAAQGPRNRGWGRSGVRAWGARPLGQDLAAPQALGAELLLGLGGLREAPASQPVGHVGLQRCLPWVVRGRLPAGVGGVLSHQALPPRPPQTSERRLLVSAAGLGGLRGHDPPVHRGPAPAVVLQQEEVRHSQGQEELSGRRRPLRGEPRCSPESRWHLGRTPQPGPPSPGPSLPQPEARAWGSARASRSPPEAIGAGPPSAAAWALEGPLVHHWGAVGRGRRCDLVRGARGLPDTTPSALPSQKRAEDEARGVGLPEAAPSVPG